MTPSDKVDLQVAEDKDGSAVIAIPENEIPKSEQPERDDRIVSSSANEPDDDDGEVDPDPGREALRQARREERKLKKQITREKTKESTHLINMLKKQNEQMAHRVAELEKRTAGADSARLDKAIEDAHLRMQYQKMKIAEATKVGDGTALADAQEAWYDARRNVEALESTKKRSVSTANSPVPQAPDPRLQKHASDWMARNDWYDPNGRDTDSKIAVKLDEALVEEGWDPTTPDYWDELDNRITKYMPHRTKGDEEHQPMRRPRTAVTGSGRESSPAARPGEFRLSPERVKAIKDAGRWDDPVERQKMARRYAEYDRSIGLR